MNCRIVNCQQGTPDWFAARIGRLTGSNAADATSKGTTRSKRTDPRGEPESEARRTHRARLALERLMNRSLESTVHTFAMKQGIEREPLARAEFERLVKSPVFQVGFLSHADLMAGASLDGYLGKFDELVSIKCREWAEHMDAVRYPDYTVPRDAMQQILHELWLTGAKAHHYVSFNPDFPAKYRLHVRTFKARDLMLEISEYGKAAELFLADVDAEVLALSEGA